MRIDVTVLDGDADRRDHAIVARPGTTWDRVAPLLPGGARRRWWCAGRELTAGSVLGVDVPPGAVLRADGPGPASPPPAGHRLEVVGGPDAGYGVPLGRAPVTVGRDGDCGLVLRDPRVSRLHATVTLTARGAVLRDCGSASGTWVEGVPVSRETVPLSAGDYLRVGDDVLCVAGSEPPSTDGPPSTQEIVLPESPRPVARGRIPWAASLLPAVVGGGLALALHSAQFLLFAALTPLTALLTAAADHVGGRRQTRRAVRRERDELARARGQIAAGLAAETRLRRGTAPGPAALGTGRTGPPRERGTPELLTVRLGLGELPSWLRVRDARGSRPAGIVRAVPVRVDLARGPLGIAGPPRTAGRTARWVVAQLAVLCRPANLELRLLVGTDAESRWRWARWLPHLGAPPAMTPDEQAALIAELTSVRDQRAAAGPGGWAGPWLVVVSDGCAPPGLAELLRAGPRVRITAVIVGRVMPPLGEFAATAVVTGDTGGGLVVHGCTDAEDSAVDAVADQVGAAWCDRLARALASPGESDGCSLPELLGLHELGPNMVLDRWRRADDGLVSLLGRSAAGPVELDLVRDGPHALVAGTTGSGKSELLRTLVTGLAVRYPPDQVGFVLVDFKGGAAFAECARLPHTVGTVTDLDARLAARALESLTCELRRRERLFAEAGVRDLDGYRAARRAGRGTDPLGRLVIVVDEFAELSTELAEFVTGLVGIARRGRSLGVHLVLATQRPAGVVTPEMRANTAVRIALRVTDIADSQDVLDTPDAAAIDRGRPGQAYLRVPGSAPILLQTAPAAGPMPGRSPAVRVLALDHWRRLAGAIPGESAEADAPSGLAVLVEALRAAARLGGRLAQRSPWLPPLPASLPLATLAVSAGTPPATVPFGLVDLPRAQRQEQLTVDLTAGGSLLLAGGPRSGRTGGLLALAVSAASRLPPDRLHVHGIDHAGGGLADLAELPHCGSLVVDDAGAAARLLARLAAEVARRRAATRPDGEPALLVLLDGWEQFLAAAEQHGVPGAVETLLALLRDGPAAGLTVAIGGDRGTLAARLCSAVSTRLALRLTDRADYALLGLPARSVPDVLPPGRAVRAADAAEIQLAQLGPEAIADVAARWPAGDAARPAPLRVRALPRRMLLAELFRDRSPQQQGTASAPVLLGVGGDDAGPLSVDLLAGRRRLIVAGPPGSGRSTVLLTLLRQLTSQGHSVVVAGPEHCPPVAAARARGLPVVAPDGPLPTLPGTGPVIVLADDSTALRDHPAGEADVVTSWRWRFAVSRPRRAGRGARYCSTPGRATGNWSACASARAVRTARPGAVWWSATPRGVRRSPPARCPSRSRCRTNPLRPISPCGGSGGSSVARTSP